MIDFMVIGLPRSGTTWAANWLTTDTTICIHDPLARFLANQLDDIQSTRMVGVACTALAMAPDWLNAHPARKVVLHRPPIEVKTALEAQGFKGYELLDLGQIAGQHRSWLDLFNDPAGIYEFLLQKPFDVERHAELKQMNVQVDYERVRIDPTIARRYLQSINRAAH